MKIKSFTLALACCASAVSLAGPYPSFTDPAAQVLPNDVVRWGGSIVDYSPAPGVDAEFSVEDNGLGMADGTILSLGDLDATQIADGQSPGMVTVRLRGTAFDGPGPDLALFENAGTFFGDPFVFAELAFVEVSSNGVDFARFPATSLNTDPVPNPDFDDTMDPSFTNQPYIGVPHEPDTTAIDAGFGRDFAGVNTTNLDNLAGIHPTGIGTPFDLAELQSHDAVLAGDVDLSAIQYVRIVDIPGDGSFVDAAGRPILDAWPTVGSGGFDLDAVGAINSVPEPASMLLFAASLIGMRLVSRRAKSRR